MQRLQQGTLGQFVLDVLRRFERDRCFQVASGLTFTTLLALVPLAMLTVTVLSMAPGFTGIALRFDDMLAGHILPESLGRAVTRYFEQVAPQARRLTVIGVAGLVVTALLTMHSIERAFNDIWRVPYRAPTARRFVMYWAVLTLGPILIGTSLTITSYLLSMSLGLFGGAPYVEGVLVRVVPAVLTVAAFTLLYFLVPGWRVAALHALAGGMVAGVLFELAKRGFAFYVSSMTTYATVYGTFAAVPAFLLWVYVSWMVAIVGAEVAALMPDYGHVRFEGPQPPGLAFCEAVKVLKVLAGAHALGEVRALEQLAAAARLPVHRCEHILEDAAGRDWVGRLASERWALVRDPATIRLADVYRAFGTAPQDLARLADIPDVAAALQRLDAAIDSALGLTLRELAAPAAADRADRAAR